MGRVMSPSEQQRGRAGRGFWRALARRMRRSADARRLAEHETNVRAALDNMSLGVCMFDKSQRLVICNQRYRDMYKLSPDIVKPGCTLRDLVANRKAAGLLEQDVDDYSAQIVAATNEGPSKWVIDLPDGRSIQQTTRPFPDGGWLSTHEDITEQR